MCIRDRHSSGISGSVRLRRDTTGEPIKSGNLHQNVLGRRRRSSGRFSGLRGRLRSKVSSNYLQNPAGTDRWCTSGALRRGKKLGRHSFGIYGRALLRRDILDERIKFSNLHQNVLGRRRRSPGRLSGLRDRLRALRFH